MFKIELSEQWQEMLKEVKPHECDSIECRGGYLDQNKESGAFSYDLDAMFNCYYANVEDILKRG